MTMKFKILAATVALFAFAGMQSSLRAQNLTFSGGNGMPLTITLLGPVYYTLTSSGYHNIGLLVDGFALDNGYTGGGSLSISNNAASPVFFYYSGPGTRLGLPANSSFFSTPVAQTFSAGDTVVLNPGTFTTTYDYPDAPPMNGTYASHLIAEFGDYPTISDKGTSVPETGWTAFLLAVGLLPLLGFRRSQT